jgi:hypothetical protein
LSLALILDIRPGVPSVSDDAARESLLGTLQEWTRCLNLPCLADLGVAESDFGRIVAGSRGSSIKTNSVTLGDAEVERILWLRFGGVAS